MADAIRLMLLTLALGMGLAAITFSGLLFQARRTALFRALLVNIALFNLLILAGLAFWSMYLQMTTAGPVIMALLLAGMAILKVAWLVAFMGLVRLIAPPPTPRRVAGPAGLVLLVLHWILLGIGLISGQPFWVDASILMIEVAVLLGALWASGWLLLRARDSRREQRREILWFSYFHLVVFTAMAGGLIWRWMIPGGNQAVPVTSSLLMMAYNLFPLVWVRAFHSRRDEDGSAALDRHGITPREREIIQLICAGKTNQEIADALFISLATVKDHNHNIFRKAGIRNRVELVNRFRSSDRLEP